MTAQNFENVFQKLSLSMGIQEAFSGTEVRRLTIHKKERSVSMEISAKELIPLQKREDLSKHMAELDKEVFRLESHKAGYEEASEKQINYMWDE